MSDKIAAIKSQVLKKIKPSEKEIVKVNDMAKKLIEHISALGYPSVVVGSIGKHTWLSGDHDIDIFVLFDKSVQREDLETRGLEIGRAIAKKLKTKPILKYAEHPYTQLKFSTFEIDIVPCYKISNNEKIQSAVDRSPLHLEYMLKNLTQEQQDEVRLLKQFMKGIGVYGSDVKQLGFSGYVAELLVLQFGTFEAVLQAASNWQLPQQINIKDPRQAKFSSPMIVIDPTDQNRNAAAAISAESMIKFMINAKQFLSEPNKDQFFAKVIPLLAKQADQIKKRGTELIAVVAKRPDVIEDTLFPQLRKASKRIEKIFIENDFRVFHTTEYADKNSMIIIFELAETSLPDIKQMIGPPIYDKHHAKEFTSKYSKAFFGPFIVNDRWLAEIPRKHKQAQQMLKSFQAKPIDQLIESGIPKFVTPELKKARIIDTKSTWHIIKKNKKLSDYVRKRYFERLV